MQSVPSLRTRVLLLWSTSGWRRGCCKGSFDKENIFKILTKSIEYFDGRVEGVNSVGVRATCCEQRHDRCG